MALADDRMKELAALYGNLGEVDELSALRAAKDDINGSKSLNKEDISWLQNNIGYIVPVDNSSAKSNTFYKRQHPCGHPRQRGRGRDHRRQ